MGGKCWQVAGVVQGVGFRWFVQRTADRLHLVGYAENLPDGRVEVAASGSDDALARLEAALGRGPSMARVDNLVHASYPHEVDSYKSFIIK